MTVDDFAKIFYSRYSLNTDWEIVEDISLMHEEGMFELEQAFVAKSNRFLGLIDQIERSRYKIVVESGDGISHQALKGLAAKFLVSHFGVKKANILYEYPFLGLETDVIDRDCTLPAECGDTNAAKFEQYFLSDQVRHLVVVPYPHNTDIFAYIFTPLPVLKKYLQFKRLHAMEKIRQIR